MALVMGKLYDALRHAGVADDEAREAAEEVADFKAQPAEMRVDLAAIREAVKHLTWTTRFVAVGILAMLVQGFLQ